MFYYRDFNWFNKLSLLVGGKKRLEGGIFNFYIWSGNYLNLGLNNMDYLILVNIKV